jgi:hypothetical protein
MPSQTRDVDVTSIPAGGCQALWRAGVPCPNEWSGAIEVVRSSRGISEPGYGKFCPIHMAGYQQYNPDPTGERYKVWTRDEFIAAGRGEELDRLIAEARVQHA